MLKVIAIWQKKKKISKKINDEKFGEPQSNYNDIFFFKSNNEIFWMIIIAHVLEVIITTIYT